MMIAFSVLTSSKGNPLNIHSCTSKLEDRQSTREKIAEQGTFLAFTKGIHIDSLILPR